MTKKLAQVAVATQPRFLSMVKTPANRTGFKVIRSDEADMENEKPKRRTRRKDSKDGMLFIALPTDFTEDQAMEVMDKFGLEEDYELSMKEGEVRLIRSDLKDAEDLPDTIAIRLDDTSTAHVTTASFKHTLSMREDKRIAGAALASVEFENTTEDAVKAKLSEYGLEYSEESIDRVDDETFIYTYKEIDDVKRTDRVELTKDICARIYRADSNDMPLPMYNLVIEEAYGSYGYGHIDFFAAMADSNYTDAAYDASYTLVDILRDITIYSGLNLDVRVDLMNNALSQYSFYMTELMNSLPRSVVLSVTSETKKPNENEEDTMTVEDKNTATTDNVEAKRSDDATSADEQTTDVEAPDTAAKREDEGSEGADAAKDEKSADDSVTMSRADLQKMISDSVTAALAAQSTASRDDAKTDTTSADEPEAKAAEADTSDDTATRSDDAITKLAESVAALATKVEELGDTSTVRYDDTATRSDEPASVFSGAIFGKAK